MGMQADMDQGMGGSSSTEQEEASGEEQKKLPAVSKDQQGKSSHLSQSKDDQRWRGERHNAGQPGRLLGGSLTHCKGRTSVTYLILSKEMGVLLEECVWFSCSTFLLPAFTLEPIFEP